MSSIVEFLKRHKTKLILTGGAVGAVVVINKILSSFEKQWQTSSSRGFVHEARKKEIHFENIITECNSICQNLSPKIINHLQRALDDTALVERLSDHGQDLKDKVEIWKILKVKILTRLLSEVYSTCILVCYLRVQMSVIGGHVFYLVANNTSGPSSASAAEMCNMKAYNKYVTLLGNFYDERFDSLIQPIEEAVEEALGGYDLKYKITLQDFKTIFEKIKRSMSFCLSSPTSKTKVFFLDSDKLSTIDVSTINPSIGPLNEKEEEMLRQMLGETQDILESDDFQHVLESSLEVGYSILMDLLVGAFIKMESKMSSKQDRFSNPNSIQIPLAKILPEIRSAIMSRSDVEQRTLVNHLLCLDVLNCFAANVYEAFCLPR